MNPQDELRAGAAALGLDLLQSQFDQLLEYSRLLQKWNKTYNLTSLDAPHEILTHHLFDSLSIATVLAGAAKVLDVGSGAGLPGIPLAIALPDTIFVLLDSNSKKTRFMRQAIAHCGIRNAQVVHARVQDYHAPDSIDFIVSRAYAPLAKYCDSVAHLLEPGTRLLTMKAGLKRREMLQLDSTRFRFEEQDLDVPGISEPRSLVRIIVI